MKKQIKPKAVNPKKFIIMLVIILAVVELFISHHLATEGQIVRELELKTEELSRENQIIRERVARIGSLQTLAAKAAEINLTRSVRIVSFTSEIPVALKR